MIDAWFHRYVDGADRVLDLGCGWGPFINQIDVAERYGIDLNPDAKNHLVDGVTLFEQRADDQWPLDDGASQGAPSRFVQTRDEALMLDDRGFVSSPKGSKLVTLDPKVTNVS